MTRQEADRVIDRLASNWPKEPLPAATRATYLLAIADLDYGLAQAATLQAIATRTFFPRPAELRQIAAELVQAADGRPSAEEAWDEFYAAARKWATTSSQSGRTRQWRQRRRPSATGNTASVTNRRRRSGGRNS